MADHYCLHEQDFGKLLYVCSTELPAIKTSLLQISAALEKISLLDERLSKLPCETRHKEYTEKFKQVAGSKRTVLMTSASAFGGFVGGLTAVWAYIRFVLPGSLEHQLPRIVKEILPTIIDGLY